MPPVFQASEAKNKTFLLTLIDGGSFFINKENLNCYSLVLLVHIYPLKTLAILLIFWCFQEV